MEIFSKGVKSILDCIIVGPYAGMYMYIVGCDLLSMQDLSSN
jgi:hypothetical protein